MKTRLILIFCILQFSNGYSQTYHSSTYTVWTIDENKEHPNLKEQIGSKESSTLIVLSQMKIKMIGNIFNSTYMITKKSIEGDTEIYDTKSTQTGDHCRFVLKTKENRMYLRDYDSEDMKGVLFWFVIK